ncbi:MAG TPA: KpsF/GutQ family sugar-phosphate isomerase [Pirellula sp.]|nr:KpsF/GutQ family sugar-phosphate isomerase [Pirellula sp.]
MNIRLPARRNGASATAKRKRLARGIEILQQTAQSVHSIAESLDEDFLVAVDKLVAMRGSLIVCGIGKAGLVGRKLAATFASTGTRAHFLHPAEAVHGDLGRLGPADIVLMLSNSGATEEIVRLLPYMVRRAAGLIAITSGANSPLARAADIALILPPCREACQHNLAPSTSTTAMLALGDALALVVSEAKNFCVQDFAELHPGGSLGRKLAIVDDVMRPVLDCRLATTQTTIRKMLVEVSRPGRRTGAVMLVNADGKLQGIFTDSDLARLLEQRRDDDLDKVIADLMTRSFSAVRSGARFTDAVDLMVQHKISELPVVDAEDKPLGMIDITDVLGLEHAAANELQRHPTESTSKLSDEDIESIDWHNNSTTLRIFGPDA